jgi:DNA-binding MarR family transcriptional regulator
MSTRRPPPEPFIGGLLRFAWQHVRARIDAGVAAAGFDQLNPAHLALFRSEGFEGLRPTEIADQMQVTKQSVNDLLGDLERMGFIERRPDPADARARLVHLTPLGRKLDRIVRREAEAAEQEIANALDRQRFQEFRQTLIEVTELLAAGAAASSPPTRR